MGGAPSVEEVVVDNFEPSGDGSCTLKATMREILREIEKVLLVEHSRSRSGREVKAVAGFQADRGVLSKMIERGNAEIRAAYELAWASSDVGARLGRAERGLSELLESSAALEADFSPREPVRVSIGNVADTASIADRVAALLALAAKHGDALHATLQGSVLGANGEYFRGPWKLAQRIEEKARAAPPDGYGGDVARVVDVERATGIFRSADDLNLSISLLRGAQRRGEACILRCKDRLSEPVGGTGYRDLLLNAAIGGFVGELQLTLRRLHDIKTTAHRIYSIERCIDAPDAAALRDTAAEPGLESEELLRLVVVAQKGKNHKGDVIEACGGPHAVEAALGRVLPPGCRVANLYSTRLGDAVVVRLSADDIGAVAALRDAVLAAAGSFDASLRAALPTTADVRADRGAFAEGYARLMMRFAKLTPHQRARLEDTRLARVSLLLAPAGGGKTWVAIQRCLEVVRSDAPSSQVLFVSRSASLALFVAKWLVVASRAKATYVLDRLAVLVPLFDRGPRRVAVVDEPASSLSPPSLPPPRLRRRLAIADADTNADASLAPFGIVVVDEAHHLAGDVALRARFAALGAATDDRAQFLFLADASQSSAVLENSSGVVRGAALVRSIVELPPQRSVRIIELKEVVRSTKRVVAGAAAFEMHHKASAVAATASVGPALKALVFDASGSDDNEPALYAARIVDALRRAATDLSGIPLGDRVAIVVPDAAFAAKLQPALEATLVAASIPLGVVDAAYASAALPPDDADAASSSSSSSLSSRDWLVLDTVDNFDGLERLVVFCVGLDEPIGADKARSLEARSRLYRSITRAQFLAVVINVEVRGGWLEFLGHVKLSNVPFDAERGAVDQNAADTLKKAAAAAAAAPPSPGEGDTSSSQAESKGVKMVFSVLCRGHWLRQGLACSGAACWARVIHSDAPSQSGTRAAWPGRAA